MIYLPTDNTVASNTGIVDNICQPAGVRGRPVKRDRQGRGVATLHQLLRPGRDHRQMAAQILTGEADISSMPIAYAEDFTPSTTLSSARRWVSPCPRITSPSTWNKRDSFSTEKTAGKGLSFPAVFYHTVDVY